MNYRIKNEELNLKDLYNYGFELFKKNIKYILILALIVYIPMNAMSLLIPNDMLVTEIDLNNIQSIDMRNLYYNLAVYFAMICFFTPLIYGGLTSLVMDVVEEKVITISSVFSGSIEKIGKHIFTSVLYFALIGMTAVIIFPAIYFSIVYRFYAHAVAATGRWGFGAFTVSALSIKGKWFKTFGFIILTVAFSVMVSNILGMGISLVFGSFLTGQIGTIIYSVILNIIDVYFEVVIALYFVNKFYLFQKKMAETKLNGPI